MVTRSRLTRLARSFATHPRDTFRLVTRRGFFAVARHFTPVLAVEQDGVRLFVSTQDTIVGRDTFATGGLEQDTMRRLIASLPERGSELRGRVVLEIGANIGTQTVLFLSQYGAGRVIAVEPSETNVDLLRMNIAANRLQSRADVLAMALSDCDGVGRLALSGSNSGDHQVATRAHAAQVHAGRETVEVPVAMLDTLVERGDIDLDEIALVWMDAQGHEGHILTGAQQLLASRVPIHTEYWPEGLREAGGLERFHEQVARHFTSVLDLHTDDGGAVEEIKTSDLPGLAARRGWDHVDPSVVCTFTDLLMIGPREDAGR